MKIVVVNATALSSGGALTILNQFISELKKKEYSNLMFYVFVPDNVSTPSIENVSWIPMKGKSWAKRILWDCFQLKQYLKKEKICPSVVVSLQNTTINVDAPQVIYLHQPLPFSNVKWSIFKRKERVLFLYSKFYSLFIFFFSKQDTKFVVQTKWMKDALLSSYSLERKNVFVIKPNFSLDLDAEYSVELEPNFDGSCKLFYPASSLIYKNHRVIIDAMKILKEKYCFYDVEFQITFNNDDYEELNKYAISQGVSENLINLGVLKFDDVIKHYNLSSIVVFPSYIETFGLPLIEASVLNKKVVCSDKAFSRELLGSYVNATFVNYNDPQAWANAIYISNKKEVKKTKFSYENQSSWSDFFKLLN